MKKQFKILTKLTLAILVVTYCFSCKKIKDLTEFDLKYITSVTIPSSTGINLPFNLYSPDITTNSETEFELNNTRKDLIEEVNLKSLKLTLKSPSGEDFSFLKSIQIFLNADGLSELKIAWKDPVPNDQLNTLDLEVSDADFKEYIKKDKFELKVTSVTDEFIASDYDIDVFAVFHVNAEILGQ